MRRGRSPVGHQHRPPTRPVHCHPLARSWMAESKHRLPARAKQVLPCTSAGQEFDPDSECCSWPAEKVRLLAGTCICATRYRHRVREQHSQEELVLRCDRMGMRAPTRCTFICGMCHIDRCQSSGHRSYVTPYGAIRDILKAMDLRPPTRGPSLPRTRIESSKPIRKRRTNMRTNQVRSINEIGDTVSE